MNKTGGLPASIEQHLLPHLDELRARAAGLHQRSSTDADDLFQDTVERALRRSACLAQPHRSRWLMRVMFNVFVDGWRRRTRSRPLTPVDESRLASAPPYAPCAWEMFTEADVRRAMAQLPPLQRRVVELGLVEKRSYKAIARELGIPVPTVGTRLHRARRRMREILSACDRRQGGTA